MRSSIMTACIRVKLFFIFLSFFLIAWQNCLWAIDPDLKEVLAGGGPPTVSSFSPVCASPGTVVTINGTNFGGVSTIKINGVNATAVTFVSATQVKATVASGTSTGLISVTATSGTGTSSTSISIINYTISSFSPSSGAVGTTVVITGTNFTGATAVKFNGAIATYTVNSNTQITTTVPTSATTGKISITGSCGSVTSSTSFTVLSGTVTSFIPTCGLPGTSVVITGTGFTGATGVKFNGTSATTYIVNSATQVTATVPAGATSGTMSVLSSTGNPITSAASFTIPALASFSPASAPTGANVVINGSGFSGATSVTFNGITATYVVNSSTQITAVVPAGNTSGTIAVNTPCANVSKTGFVLVPSCASNVVYIYTSSQGSTGSAKGYYNQPSAIAIGSLGQKYIADGLNNRVQCGSLTWGTQGPADGQFDYPSGLALGADDRVYVADRNNNRIQFFDASGVFLGKWGGPGSLSGQFNSPHGVAVDVYGNVYVCDRNNHRVQKFTGAGTFISQLGTGTAGSASGQFNEPVGVAVDNNGNIFVTDKNNQRVQKFNSTGTPLTSWFVDRPWGIAIDASNNVYVSDVDKHMVEKFTNAGTYLTQVGDFGIAGSINTPTGIAIDQSCNMFIIDYNNAVQLYTPFTPPTLSSFSPSCGVMGTQVTIIGTGFNTATSVKFNGVSASSFNISGGTQIIALVPAGATTGKISITTIGGTGYTATDFTMTRVMSIAPTCGVEGTIVTLTGSNFTGATQVYFNGVPAASYTVNSNTQITATVPVGATIGAVSVATPCGTAIGQVFTVLKLDNIFTPSCGASGTAVTITGVGLNGTTDVMFNGISSTYIVNSATQITATVPAGASTGKISITNPCGSLTSLNDYTISGIFSLTPSCGVEGTTVTLTGSNFTGVSGVSFAGPPWANKTTGASTSLLDVDFVDPSTGFISGSAGILLKTMDGGNTFTSISTGTTSNLYAVDFIDTQHGFVAGDGSTVLETFNGGLTWSPANIAANGNVRWLKFVNSTTGYLSSSNNVFKTSNAGASWTSIYTGTSSTAYSVQFMNSSVGYISGYISSSNQAMFKKTSDGGTTWTDLNAGSGNSIVRSAFLDQNIGLICEASPTTSSAVIKKTINGGATWTTVYTDANNTYSKIIFVNGSTVFCVGGNIAGNTSSLLRSDNAGATWTTVSISTNRLTSMCAVNGSTFYATGLNGVLLKGGGVPATSFNVTDDNQLTAVVPAGAVSGPVSVATTCGTISSSNFTISRMTSFSPTCGIVGTSVIITGENFIGTTGVKFNGVDATTFTVDNNTQITAVVPTGATTGKLSVMTSCGILNSVSDFRVSGITSFTPTSGYAGTLVAITGLNFLNATSVSFNGAAASMFEIKSNTVIEAVVPVGVTSGNISIGYSGCSSVISANAFQAATQLCTASASQTYTYNAQWGASGSGPGKFNVPNGIAIDPSGNIFIADTDNNRVQKFKGDGTFIKEWGGFGSNDGEFKYAYSVAVDLSGNVYVTDKNNYRVQKFDNDGIFLAKWGQSSPGNSQFADPTGIAVDPLGYVYVIDYSNQRVKKFTSSGTYVREWSGIGNALCIAVDASGTTYVPDLDNNVIRKFTKDGVPAGQISCNVPRGVALDNMGNIYVTTDNVTNIIKKFSTTGTLLSQWGTSGAGDGQFAGVPLALAVDPACNVHVADRGNNRVQVFQPNNAPSFTITYPTSASEWRSRESRTISWTSSNIHAAAPVKIELFDGTNWNTVSTTATNAGSYTITQLPLITASTANSKIRISLASNPAVQKTSSSFILDPPSITVTAPTSGDVWTSGGTATVTWTSLGLLPGEGITLYLIDGQQLGHLLTTTADNGGGGSVTVNVPNWLVPDGHAKIFAHLSFETLISDYGDEFTVAPACQSTFNTYPYSEGFETDLGQWQQSTTDDFDWTRQTGPTYLNWSGPDAAHSGSYYVYTDGTGSNSPWKAAVLYSSCFDFAPLTSPELRFWYHMYGYGMGTMQVQISTDRGGNWSDALWLQEGDKGNVWRQAIVDLSAYQGKIIMLRIIGNTRWTHSSDMAIDDIWLGEKPNPCPAVITAYPHIESFEGGLNDWVQSTNDDAQWSLGTGPTPNVFTGPDNAQDGATYIYLPSDIPFQSDKVAGIISPCFDLTNVRYPELRFWYHMYGTNMGDMEIQISTDGGTSWETEPIWTRSGDQTNTWHEAVIDLTPYKTRSFKFRVVGSTYSISQSDMAIDHVTVQNANPCNGISYSVFPYQESFEGAMTGWVQSTEDDKNWVKSSQPSIRAFTGASTIYDGANYLYLDAFDPVFTDLSAITTSPCFDLTSLTTPSVSFFYNMYGPDNGLEHMGTLDFQVSDNNGAGWTSLWTKTGDQGNSWHEAIVDISDYIDNSIRFRFIGTTGTAFRSDMGIDKFRIDNKSITITQPVSVSVWDAESTQTITWNTFGILPTEFVSIELYDGAVWQMLVASTVNDGAESVIIPPALVTYTSQIRITLLQDPPIPPELPDPVTVGVSTNFTVNVPESITIVDPSAGVDWVTGFSHILNWTSTGLLPTENVSIEYFDGSSWQMLVPSTVNDGTHVVTIPVVTANITTAQIKITVISNGITTYGLSNVFTLSSPFISISTPVDGSNVIANSNVTVNWTSNISTTESVAIELYNGSSWSVLKATTANDGSESVVLPIYCSATSASNAQIKLTSLSNTQVFDNNIFTLVAKQELAVVSPVASTIWISGSTQTLTWNSCGISGSASVLIELFNGVSWVTIKTTTNDLSESITVPAVSSSTGIAKVRLTHVGGTAVGLSPNFTLNALYCSGTTALSGTSGTFTDGSASNNYNLNSDCNWTITVPSGKYLDYTINVTGLDGRTTSFNGTRNYFSTDLATFNYMTAGGGDYLLIKEVYPGRSGWGDSYNIVSGNTYTGTNRISTDYGSDLYNPLFSPINVTFKFYSDASVVAQGWSITWSLHDVVVPIPPYCSGTVNLTGTSGIITDGSQTLNYQNNMNCYWKIPLPANKAFFYRFNCALDNRFPGGTFFNVYNGVLRDDNNPDANNNGKLLSQIAGDAIVIVPDSDPNYNVQSIVSLLSGNSQGSSLTDTRNRTVTICFHSDNTIVAGGFTLEWWVRDAASPPFKMADEELLANDNLHQLDFSVYPNPAQDKLTIEPNKLTDGNYKVSVLNNLGELVLESSQVNCKELDLRALSEGVYTIKIEMNENVFTKKIIHIK